MLYFLHGYICIWIPRLVEHPTEISQRRAIIFFPVVERYVVASETGKIHSGTLGLKAWPTFVHAHLVRPCAPDLHIFWLQPKLSKTKMFSSQSEMAIFMAKSEMSPAGANVSKGPLWTLLLTVASAYEVLTIKTTGKCIPTRTVRQDFQNQTPSHQKPLPTKTFK